jgi:carbon storage regulator
VGGLGGTVSRTHTEGKMLVLSRKRHETINIGDDIVVRVLSVNGSRVKIAVEAPDGKKILRGELIERDRRESGESDAA